MSKTAQYLAQVKLSGDGLTGNGYLLPTITNALTPGSTEPFNLASGDNEIPVKEGAIGVIFVPPTDSIVTKKHIKGSGLDGPTMRPEFAPTIGIPDGATAIWINADGPEIVFLVWI